jgi:hypothetical protein
MYDFIRKKRSINTHVHHHAASLAASARLPALWRQRLCGRSQMPQALWLVLQILQQAPADLERHWLAGDAATAS